MKKLLFILLPLFLGACDSTFKSHESVFSPDRALVIDISSEIQGANDPEPFWQHISLRESGATPLNKKGNLLIYSSRTVPRVIWKSDRHLEIVIKDVTQAFPILQTPRVLDEIDLTLIIERPSLKTKRTEQGAAANP